MKLMLDEQQPARIAVLLREAGHDVVGITETEAMRGRADHEVLETAVAQHRALLTENIRDFALLHRQWLDEGRSHYGILLASAQRFARRRGANRTLLAALRSLLRVNPSDQALRDQLIWLG